MLKRIEVPKSLREQVPYPDSTFPFCVWVDIYNEFIDKTVNCHWHYDFEFGYVLSGTVDYYINDTHMELNPGDCVFVNSNMLHMSRQVDSRGDAVMFTLTFPVSFLTMSNHCTLYVKYFQPILEKQLEGFIIRSHDKRGRKMRDVLTKLYALEPLDFGYELESASMVNQLWMATLQHVFDNHSNLLFHTNSMAHVERAKEILSYIHANYNEKITVEHIAAELSISRSECFRSFKRFMNKRPVEYINEYRLQRAAKLLRETEKSLTAIAGECGFENGSYFGKVFKKVHGVSPLLFRKYKGL